MNEAGIEIPYPYRVLTFTRNEPLIYEQLARAGLGPVEGDGEDHGHQPAERTAARRPGAAPGPAVR